jgi:hypothetical protein
VVDIISIVPSSFAKLRNGSGGRVIAIVRFMLITAGDST